MCGEEEEGEQGAFLETWIHDGATCSVGCGNKLRCREYGSAATTGGVGRMNTLVAG